MKVFLERQERGVAHTIFSNSREAVERALDDRSGGGQTLRRTIIELERERGSSVTIRWTPAHKCVEGNEVTDDPTRWAAEALTTGLSPNI